MNKLLKNILWLFFTNRCKYCNTLIKKDEDFCDDCRDNLPVIKGDKCKFCGVEKSRCDCKKHKTEYDGITSPFYYEDSIALAVRRLKFYGKTFIADALAQKMAESINADFKDIDFDCVCYVPFTLSQKIKRKYNQSELIAERVSHYLDLPLSNIMVKLFDTDSQHDMGFRHRKGNVFGIYDIKDNADVKGKTILLVDDVKTSGATLNDCARILKIRGAESVYVATAAIASAKNKRDKNNNS